MPDAPAETPPRPDSDALVADEGQAARRGFLAIAGAKVWFLVCGTLLNIGLPRLLGSPEAFGDFGVVNTFVSILNMVVVAGALQAVSKRVSEAPGSAHAVRRHALKLMGVVGGLAFLVLVGGADLIASYIFQDPRLAAFLRVAAVVTLSYSLYAVYVGIVNGLKRFELQAGFDVAFATLKLVGVAGLVAVGFGVMGAFVGFAAAAVTITLAAAWRVGRLAAPEAPPTDAGAPAAARAGLGAFMAQVMGYTLLVNVLLQGDVLVVKAGSLGPTLDALSDPARRVELAALLGQADDASSITAEKVTAALTGLYRATKNVSLIPYQAVIAITFVVFPLVSRATFQDDHEATRTYVRQAMRTAALLVALLATVLAAGGPALLSLLFGDRYALAGAALTPMVAGMATFALLYVLATVLTAAGHPRDALAVAFVTVAVQLAGLAVISSAVPPGAASLAATAWGATAAIALGFGLAAWRLVARVGVGLPGLTLARLALASAAGFGASLFGPAPAPADAGADVGAGALLMAIFVRAAIAGVAFVATTFATGELGRRDVALALGAFRRRG